MRPELEPKYDDVAVVISELVTNSVRHGRGTAKIGVLVKALEKHIRLEVRDTGPCFKKGASRREGMGLDIVDRIAERWGVVHDSACTVWVEIARA